MKKILFASAIAAMLVAVSPLDAQQSRIPRTPDGKPDLQGTWDSFTATPLQRPKEFADREFMTEQEAKDFAARSVDRFVENLPAVDRLGADLNYIYFEHPTVVDLRTALITDPADGRVPPLTPEAQKRFDNRVKTSYDDPETRPFDERCLISQGNGSSNAAPPLVPNGFGQNLYQIVQTRDAVVIFGELIHDARVIRIGGPHAPPRARFWLGDSVGRWEGDTLVVDTTNFNDRRKWRGSTENIHVVERLTRLKDRIRYSFTVEDPDTWTKPWSGEVAFLPTTDRMFEYACHEGNYAMEGGLRGARADERARQP